MLPRIPVIAVLITCHNRKEKTLSCLRYLFDQQGKNTNFLIEVFLVDDASTDGTAEGVAGQFPDVTIIQGDGNLFWTRGMRLAWETAVLKQNFDFYLWLNDDTYIYSNAILLMLENFSRSGRMAVISGATQSKITAKCTYGGRSKSNQIIIPDKSLQACLLMNGNFVLISRKIFHEVGFIDNIFHHGLGDHDYGLRAIKKGYNVFVSSEYTGTCEEHEKLPDWCSPDVPLVRRIKRFYSPRGFNPNIYFIYEKRHFGLAKAIKHFITIHVRVLAPALWT